MIFETTPTTAKAAATAAAKEEALGKMAAEKIKQKELQTQVLTSDDIHHHHDEHQLRTVIAGGVAAAVTRVFVQPLDVLKVRFQLQVEPLKCGGAQNKSKYTSMYQAISTIAKEEGASAFWKGHTPAQGLSIMYGIVQFWGYEQLKGQAKQMNLYHSNKNLANFICGGLAGALGTAVTTPLDVIRTRLIAQDNKRGYPNTFRAGMIILRTEGLRGVYRGLVPAMIQITPLTGINFMIYNRFCSTTVEIMKLESKRLATVCMHYMPLIIIFLDVHYIFFFFYIPIIPISRFLLYRFLFSFIVQMLSFPSYAIYVKRF